MWDAIKDKDGYESDVGNVGWDWFKGSMVMLDNMWDWVKGLMIVIWSMDMIG